ncbi:DUF3800 domain-containing protein [Verrucomicrobia bacterium S94]|nr:DUF3800 domain-containing protein [Verrucomicrobia bacterium S94]
MYLAYYDEAGDDGFPDYSSPLFVLSTVYTHFQNWKSNYEHVHSFRKQLHTDFAFPVKWEMHTKKFLLNKQPYRQLNLSDAERIEIMDLFYKMIAGLQADVVNVAILKPNIRSLKYEILDRAFTYSIQRIENHLQKIGPKRGL